MYNKLSLCIINFVDANTTHLKIANISHVMVILLKDTNLSGVTDTNLTIERILKLTRI
jgi:hypothetical protein